MSNQELNNYIYAQSQRGVGAEEIRKILETNGWSKADIDTAFKIVQPKGSIKPQPVESKPAMTQPLQATTLQPLQTSQQAAMQQPVGMPAIQPAASMPAGQPVVDMFDMGAQVAQPMQSAGMQTFAAQPQVMQQTATQQPSANGMMQPGESVFGAMPMQGQPAVAAQGPVHMKNGMSTKTKMLVFAVIGVIIAGAIAGGAYAYYRFYTSPERVSGLMAQNLAQLKSFQYSLQVQPRTLRSGVLAPVIGSAEVSDASMTIDGSVDIANDRQPSMSANVAVTIQSTEGTTTAIGAEARYVAGMLYASLQEANSTALPALSVLTGKWFALGATDATLGAGASPLNAIQAITAEEKAKMRDAFRTSETIVFGKKIGSETIHNAATNEYNFSLSKDGLKKFVAAVTPILTAHNICSSAQCADMLTKIDSMQDVTGQLWVGSKDYQLYQLRFVLSSTSQDALAKDVLVSLTMWNQNQSVTVEVPNPVSSFADIAQSVMSSIFGGAINTNTNVEVGNQNDNANTEVNTNSNTTTNTNADNSNTNTADTNTNSTVVNTHTTNTNAATNTNNADASADTDADGLTTAQETLYGTDANDSDTDNDGYLDGEEVDHGFNPAGPGTLEK